MKKKSAFKQKNRALFVKTELHTYHTAKLRAMVNIAVKNDYSGLIITGQPTREELTDRWLDILSDYQKNRVDPTLSGYYEEKQDRAEYESRAHRVKLLVHMLQQRYDQRLADELITEGYDYEFTEETYREDIEKVLAELESEAHYFDEEEKSPEPTERKYLAKLMELQKDLKACPMMTPMQMMDNLTISEYVEYLNVHDEYIASKTPNDKIDEDGD